MDTRQLNLDCDEPKRGQWRVFCKNTGMELSLNQPSAEAAWAMAAERMARCISEFRRVAETLTLKKKPTIAELEAILEGRCE